jgi:hypothetical protein
MMPLQSAYPVNPLLPPMGFTQFDPVTEALFRLWHAQQARRTGTNPNPDAPQHHYDYRQAYLAGVTPTPDPTDQNRPHWPSQFKMAGHPNRFVPLPGGITLDTITNLPLGDLRYRYGGR